MTEQKHNDAFKVQPWQLKQRKGMSLDHKIKMSLVRIKAYHDKTDGKMYVAYSGGRDSTVLLHLVRAAFPNVVATFNDTGLEYPEVKSFALVTENLVVLKPKKNFLHCIRESGYPLISKENAQKIREIRTTNSDKLRNKRMYGDEKGNGKLAEKWKFMIDAPFKISDRCCATLKKNPVKAYEKLSGNSAIVGTMAEDSRLRHTTYLKNGCMQIGGKRNMLTPLSFWTHADILEYVARYNLPISKIYSMGYDHTGCVFCAFGCHLDAPGKNKFSLMKNTHPQLFKYCMENLGLAEMFDYMGVVV